MEINIKNKEIGYMNEAKAVNFLQKNGFEILKRNYTSHHFEIDIIAKKDNCVHFIEVKFRKNNLFGYPESFVSSSQQERIKKAAENYLFENDIELKIMFDVISIEKNSKITFFKDAFF